MSKRIVVNAKGIEYNYTYDRTVPADLDVRHCHDTYEILFVVSGAGKYIVEGSTFSIRPATLMIIRPFEFHCVQLDHDTPYERYVIKFSPSALLEESAGMFEELMNNNGETSGKYFSPSHVPESAFSIFDRFELAASLPEQERNAYTRMLLSELIVLLSVSGGEQMIHEEDELGARVIRYLNENIHRDMPLDKLARRFFVSKYHLCRAFKKHNGISVHGYINQKRVMYAKQLIDAGETASGAAYRVGFGDYSSFYRAYVKVVGKAPTAD